MGNFDKSVSLVIGWEGPPTDDPDDLGGPTMFGIAKKSHPMIYWPPTLADAKQIYRSEYWVPVHGDDLPSPLALTLFDFAVTQGIHAAILALQVSLRVDADGIFGAQTLTAAKHSGPTTVLVVTSARLANFEEAARTRPVNMKYLAGWRNRTLLAFRESVKMELGV
jgi:lysozyme family protein